MSTASAGPLHTNRLARESSPYLLQHQHNPVDWYPWGPEALDRAARAEKWLMRIYQEIEEKLISPRGPQQASRP